MIVRRLSQVLLSGIFISGGVQQFLEPGGRKDLVHQAGIPQPHSSVRINGAVMVLGGGMLALDSAPRLGSLLLIGTLIPTTLVGHAFWNHEGQARAQQWTQFTKNMGLIAALLMVLFSRRKR